jgi:penicillin amidase
MTVVPRWTWLVALLALAACAGNGDNAPPAATATADPTPSVSPTPTASATVVPTFTASPSATATPTSVPTPTLSGADRVRALAVTETLNLPGLSGEVHVIRTEGDVPHIYARNRIDVSFVQGFVLARDRFFMMDLTRRLGLGRVSELIGDQALDVDLESRLTGMTDVADRIVAGMSSEHAAMADAFAAGVNAYVERVQARELPLPSELRLAGPLLGVSNPRTLMEPFTVRDIAGILAVIVYQSSYDGSDVGNTAAQATLDDLFSGAALESLRRAGVRIDVPGGIAPLKPVASVPGFGVERGGVFVPGPGPDEVPGARLPRGAQRGVRAVVRSAPADMLSRLSRRLESIRDRLGRVEGFGSNAWAVSGTHTASGATLVAGDGHLQLDIPPIFFQIGLDDEVFGAGTTHQLGLVIPGFFIMPVGTNGHVAWSQTQLSSDVVDWYREQIQLGADGLPAATLFHGQWQPLQRVDEEYVIRDVPALHSTGRTEHHPRWRVFDGRLLTEIEGRRTTADAEPVAGEGVVRTLSGLVIPADVAGDGVISGISFDYTAFDIGRILDGADGFGHSATVDEFREHSRTLVAYSQNLVAGDDHGGVLYTSYNAVPCRGYLPREADGRFVAGADPTQLLDGTLYGGFEVPLTDGLVDETAAGGDPQRCLVPFDSTPQSITPARGYVLTANNDPGRIAFDGSLTNDPWYIGGPWDTGFRASTIDDELAKTVQDGSGDVTRMAAIQANHRSRVGEVFVPFLLEATDYARGLTFVDRLLAPWEQRLEAAYQSDAAAMDEVEQRLAAWKVRGYEAASGVATFYHTPAANEVDDAVATMLFHAWMSRFLHGVWDDEGIDERLFRNGDQTRVVLLARFLEARGTSDGSSIASQNPDTGESAFFDRLGTPEIETSREIMLDALLGTLQFLRTAPAAAGQGGFGTADMNQWLWGLRHQVHFESLLAPFLGNDPALAIFTAPFAITTSKLPLAANLPSGDPRAGLRWFPRPGDQWNVDAGNPGFSGTDFTYGSGPVMRMVFALRDGKVSGRNIIPGGQSGLTDSPHFADQAKLWLGNDAYPVRFDLDDVLADATAHEVYLP